MKKRIITITLVALVITFVEGCSSATVAAVESEAKSLGKQEAEQMVMSYLTQKLAGGHPTLSSVLKSATSSTSMASILGGNSSNTSAFTNLVASQFGVNQQGVTNQVTSSGSTLGGLASYLVQNTNASTLTSLVSKVK